MMQFDQNSGKAIASLRLIGYGLLTLSVFDIFDILYPLQFLNSSWEFDTVGNFIERVGFPLLGFGLVFLGEAQHRTKVEKLILKPLSWMILVIACIYWLLIPITVNAAWRIYNQSNIQAVEQLSQQRTQFKTAKERLSQLSDQEVLEFAKRSSVGALPDFNAQSFREQQQTGMERMAQQNELQTQAALKVQSRTLIKKGTKWILGALVAGALFIYLWRSSTWARDKKIRRQTMAPAN